DDEINEMVNDAEKFAADDEARRQGVEKRNGAETAAHGAEKFVDDNKDKLSEGQQTTVKDLVAQVRAALASDNLEAIDKAVEDLNAALQEIGTSMYQQQAAEGAADAGSSDTAGGTDDEDVIEGEFTEE
ncbi:MAG: Hsp70 family protein, partial [Chloroflexota bacterium]